MAPGKGWDDQGLLRVLALVALFGRCWRFSSGWPGSVTQVGRGPVSQGVSVPGVSEPRLDLTD